MIYIVRQYDTVDSIAYETGVQVESLIYDNQLVYPYRLAIGQALYIPDTPSEDRPGVYINGYAYPFINREILEESLGSMSTLSVFSYGFTPSGELIYPAINDGWMIEAALAADVRPVLTLTPLNAEGRFNNMLIHELLIGDMGVEQITENLIEVIRTKGFAGVNIDFEYIMREDRDLFSGFVAGLTERLNEYGYEVSVCLAPKTSADQPGLLYEGKDYGALGAAANYVLLMTYEWGYTYSEPRAVAPVNLVRRVLDYAVTEIPLGKIDMGIPNYGYDWALPYEKGVTRAVTLGNTEAVRLAADNEAVIQYDEVAQTPYFNYMRDGIEHEVWFEDVRSLSAKLALIEEYNIRGAGYWQIMRLFRPGWLLLKDMYRVY